MRIGYAIRKKNDIIKCAVKRMELENKSFRVRYGILPRTKYFMFLDKQDSRF